MAKAAVAHPPKGATSRGVRGGRAGWVRKNVVMDQRKLDVARRALGVETETEVRDGPAVGEILAAARERGADLIAMTTHGRSGPARALFGSVAEAVVRHASMPVFLLRITEAELTQTQARQADRLAVES